jgi:hypothetical protein
MKYDRHQTPRGDVTGPGCGNERKRMRQKLYCFGPLPDEDNDSGREEPEPSPKAHHAVLGRCPIAKELDKPHNHTEQSSQEEEPNKNGKNRFVHTLVLSVKCGRGPTRDAFHYHRPGLSTDQEAADFHLREHHLEIASSHCCSLDREGCTARHVDSGNSAVLATSCCLRHTDCSSRYLDREICGPAFSGLRFVLNVAVVCQQQVVRQHHVRS